MKMKNQISTLQNLYLSPKKKYSEKSRKVYSTNKNNKSYTKTLSNNQKDQQKNIIQPYLNRQLQHSKSNLNINKIDSYNNQKQPKNIYELIQQKQKLFQSNKNSIIRYQSTKHSNNSHIHTDRSYQYEKNVLMNTQRIQLEKYKYKNSKIIKQIQCNNKKLHQQGKNCKIILINGNTQEEHYLQVSQIQDIIKFLKIKYPQFTYYKSMPKQITLDYFLIQGKAVDGKFLNGQVLYLKPCGISDKKPRQYSIKENIKQNIYQNKMITFQSFQIIKYLGSGGFSKVYLCRFKQTGKFYAIKLIDKQFIIKNKKKQIIMNQRNVMKLSQHNFIIQMKFAFESQKFLVFVMQYCPGGELFSLVKKYRRIQEDIARFYIIQILLGLQYLHKQKVIYRDIKPQNILLSYDGHVKIADLGLAKPNMFQRQLAYSFCGSPQYMSPEMILQVGHTYPVDYYCVGALLYELLVGLPPFYSRDPDQIYEKVLMEQVQFPEEINLTEQCQSLLQGLLCKDPKKRLGSLHGIKQILAHPWFGKNSYKKFVQKQIIPPISYNCITKVNLDKDVDQKFQNFLQDVKKQQKGQSLQFKKIMRDFYYDYREEMVKNENKIMNKNKRSVDVNESKQKSHSKQLTGAFKRRKLSSSRKLSEDILKSNKMNQRSQQKQNCTKQILINLKQNQQLNFSKLYDYKYLNKTNCKDNSSTLKRMTHRSKKNLISNNTNSTGRLFKNLINMNKF